MAVKHAAHRCCIFYKRNNFNTEYLYLKFNEDSAQPSKSTIDDIYSAIKMVDDMKNTQQLSYKVILAYLTERSFTEMDKLQFLDYSNGL
jgi:hypothetical protein